MKYIVVIACLALVSCAGFSLNSQYGAVNTDKEGNMVIIIRPLSDK